MEVEQLTDIGQYLALFALVVAPPVISLVKNIGKNWSSRVKQGVSLVFATAAALGAFAAAGEWSMVDVTDVNGFWAPFGVALFAAVGGQYGSYKLIWSEKQSRPLGFIEGPLASIGTPSDPLDVQEAA